MKKEKAIELQNVSKYYSLEKRNSLVTSQIFKRKHQSFTALQNINLTIYKGDRLGIVGKNGSGKTTLLKIMSGITQPNKGKVFKNGTVVSIIDLQAGFNDDLNGIDNIYINASIIGMNYQNISKNLNNIVQYSNISKFIKEPLYKYSQGMKLRLGFAIAIHSDPDILILDESMSAGDEEFHQLAFKKLQELAQKKKTIIASNHWRPFLQSFCNRIVYLNSGKIATDGKSDLLQNNNIIV